MATTQSSRLNEEVPEEIKNNPILQHKVWGKMNRQNDNWMGAVVGETGSGKSWAAIRLAEIIDPEFSADQIAFSIREFMELVNDDSLGRGSVIVFEEASVEASAYEWYERSNQILANVLDTWRHQNRGAIFTLPSFGQLMKPARGRMSALIQMHRKYAKQGKTIAKYKNVDQDSEEGKLLTKYPIIDKTQYRFLTINKPSKELREAYESRKEEYAEELNEGLLQELIDEEEGVEEEEQSPRDVVQEIIDDDCVDEYIGDNPAGDYLDRSLLKADYGLSRSESKQVKKLLIRELDLDVM